MGPEIVNKLSTATVIGKLDPPTSETPLFILIGLAHGYKTGQSTYGDWIAFTGQFEATRKSDGKQFTSGKAFLPSAIQDLLLAAMQADKETGEIPAVQFALEIGYKPAKNAIGYTYTVTPLVKPSGNDPLTALREQVAALLPAPKQAEPAPADSSDKKSKK